MSESTLKITFSELKSEVGRYLDLDRDSDNWTADELADVTEIIKRGLRQFYFPLKTDPNKPAHRWNFLRPSATLTIWDDVVAGDEIDTSSAVYASPSTTVTVDTAAFYPSMVGKNLVFATSGNSYPITGYTSSTVVVVTGDASAETGYVTVDSEDTFTLPWDYGGMAGDGKFTYDNGEGKICSVTLTSDAEIRKLRQSSVSTGTPYLCAIVPKTTDGTEGQRWEAMFYPPPDEVLILHYRYAVLPDSLVSSTKEYPYGSAAHSETILESCLAIAETREKDGGDGSHQTRFAALLVASIDQDSTLGHPVIHYGYNGDHSDDVPDDRMQNNFDGLVTFNGS